MRPIRLKGYPPALPIWSRGDGSSQAGPGLRPSGHSRCECSLRLPASTGLRPILAFALRAIRCANVRSGFLPPQSNPAGSPPAIPSSETRKKATLRRPFFLFGGGGGSRTRVRRRLTPSTTCLAHRSISSSGSTACETHRSTSLKSFAILPSDGGIRLSHDNDGTSTSIGTSGFPAYALSGECVVVVVGN
jgi:hypothetical protein